MLTDQIQVWQEKDCKFEMFDNDTDNSKHYLHTLRTKNNILYMVYKLHGEYVYAVSR